MMEAKCAFWADHCYIRCQESIPGFVNKYRFEKVSCLGHVVYLIQETIPKAMAQLSI